MAPLFSTIKQKLESKAEILAQPHAKDNMRGLSTFIMDIRICKSSEAEKKRVNKELANIRSKFRGEKNIDGYHKRKYISKLVFIHLLGYEVNFGSSESLLLLCSNKFIEKQIGYLYLSIMADMDDQDFCKTVVQAISSDLRSHNNHFLVLAAHCVPNLICNELISEVGQDINKLLITGGSSDLVMQALLACYLAMVKFDSNFFTSSIQVNDYIVRNISTATDAVLLPMTHIIYEGCKLRIPVYLTCFTSILNQIFSLNKPKSVPTPYHYYGIQSPWTLIKLLQIVTLQPEILSQKEYFSQVIQQIINSGKGLLEGRRVHALNISNAVIFEAINVLVSKEVTTDCMKSAINFLGSMLNSSDNNYRYFSLDLLLRLKDIKEAIPMITIYVENIKELIKSDLNTSLRLKAVDVVYAISDSSLIKSIVDSLLLFLKTCDYAVKQELTLKISMLAAKNVNDHEWFVQTMMTVLRYGGSNTSEEIWFKTIQLITKYEATQAFATSMAFSNLTSTNCPEELAKLSAYILGEFGNLIANDARSSPSIQLSLIISLFSFVEKETKYVFLTALVKMANLYPELKNQIKSFFNADQVIRNIDLEIQQRVSEYSILLDNNPSFVSNVLNVMPEYSQIEEENIETPDNLSLLQESSFNLTSNETQLININFIKKLHLVNQGLLYSNNHVAIHCRIIINGSSGQFDLIIRDMMQNVNSKIISVDSIPNENVILYQAKKTDSPNGEIFTINFLCNKEFMKPPEIIVKIISNKSESILNLYSPILLEKFFSPYKMDKDRFFNIWKSLMDEEQEATIEIVFISNMTIPMILEIFHNIGFEILIGLDPNIENIVASSVFNCEEGTIGCVIRMETKLLKQSATLTTKTVKPGFALLLARTLERIFNNN